MGTSKEPSQKPEQVGPLGKLLGSSVAVAAIFVIGWIDYISGPEIGFSLFYLVPVLLSGYWLGRRSAVVSALASSAAWFCAEIAANSRFSTEVVAWNGFTRSMIFLTIGVMTAVLRRDRRRLQELLEQANESARTDPLTGLPNLRAFQESIDKALARARRGGQAVCMAYLDLDNFKKVNDHYGHTVGNEVLVRVSTVMRSVLRETDMPARIGGDEFSILLWNVTEEQGTRIAGRLIEGIAGVAKEYPLSGLGLSIGVMLFDQAPESAERLLQEADAAMYQAKAAGKGRAVVLHV